MHLVKIRWAGRVIGVQLRMGSGGSRLARYFSVRQYGSADAAERAARATARSMGGTIRTGRGGSMPGRHLVTNKSGAAGIQFRWRRGVAPSLCVVATWSDRRNGRARYFSASTEKHGLEHALDLALAARRRAGAPEPDRAQLLKNLRAARRTGPEA